MSNLSTAMNRLLLCTTVGAVPVALAALPPAPFDLERDVANVMPADVLLYAEAPGLPDLCEQGLSHPLIKTILASPLGTLISTELGMPPSFALGGLNVYAGRPVLPTLAQLTKGGFAIGVIPAEPKPITCIVARGDDALWNEVLEDAMNRVAEAQELPKERVVPPHRKIRGMDVWLLGDFGAMAYADGLFVGATDEDTLRRMIELGGAEGVTGLASRDVFTAARDRYRSNEAFVWSWFDLQGLDEAYASQMTDLRTVVSNPGAQLLLGPSIANITGATSAALEVRFGGDRIDLELFGLATPEGPANEILAPVGATPPALPAAKADDTARAVLYRDLQAVFKHRVELFPVDAQPGFAEAISNLALFFGGQDITDDLLPSLEPWIGVIARPVEFDEGAVPDIPLPGAAALVRTSQPDAIGSQLVAATQSLLSILNINAAQNQEPVLTVKLELHEGHTITYGTYRRPDEGEGVDARYNLEPACALVGNTFVLGTHRNLVKELVGQISRGEFDPPERGEMLEFSGTEIARVIEANMETLVLNAVLSDGKTEKQARKEIKGLRTLSSLIDVLRFETARPAARDLRASLSLILKGK